MGTVGVRSKSGEDSAVLRSITPYAVLLVRPTDEDLLIRQTYHAVAQTEHPDANGGVEGLRWQEVTDAYNAIKTVVKRIAWEAQLRIQARTCKKCRGYGVSGSRVGGGSVKVCVECDGVGRTK